MRILIFGASGQTGRQLVEQGLARGHHVTGFVRSVHRMPLVHPAFQLATGDVTDAAAVAEAIRGHDAALSALGPPSPARRYPPLTVGLRNIVAAMERVGVPRLIYLSFLGVPAGRHQLPAPFRNLVALALKHSIADHEANEALLERSALDWTIVRAPKLTNGRRTGNYRSGDAVRGGWPVPLMSRADVADFILEQLVDPRYVRKAPAIVH